MNRSMLVFQDRPPRNGADVSLTLVALHGYGGDLDELVPLWQGLTLPVRLFAPQASRPVHAPDRSYSPENGDGYRWHFGNRGAEPEPATFGESLWNVEQFVYDVRDSTPDGQPVVLVGFDQGALVALTLATVIPDCLAGVIAIGGFLPFIRGWASPIDSLESLPVLYVQDEEEAVGTVADRTMHELEERKAFVTNRLIRGVLREPSLAAGTISDWLTAHVIG